MRLYDVRTHNMSQPALVLPSTWRGQALAKRTTTRVTNHNSSPKLTRLVLSGETHYASGLELAFQSLELAFQSLEW